MSTIFLCFFVLMLVLANRAWSPTATSPSAEDFSGLTLDAQLAISSGVVPLYWGFRYYRLFVVLPSQTIVGAIQIEDANGQHVVPGELGWRMTALDAPSPFVVSASPTDLGVGFIEWKCFNGLQTTGWNGYPGGATKWLKIDTGIGTAAKLIRLFPSLYSGTGAPYAPTTFRLEGSHTGAFAGEEVTLLSVSGYSWSSTSGVAWDLTYPTSVGTLTAEQPTTGAFEPTGGAKLAALTSITPTLDATGAAGTVTLYSQHYNTPLGAWCSLTDVAGEWTSHGAVTSGVAIDLSSTTCRAGEKYRWKAEFTSTDGTLPPPKLTGLSLAWTSDTTAPSAPTIGYLISACDTGATAPGYRIGAAIPTGARHLIMEANVNAGGFLPISQRARREAGQGYLEFVGDLAATEQAGGRNEVHYSDTKSLVVGDSVVVRVAAVDAVGNQSAWTTSSALTLASTSYVTLNTDAVTVSVAPETAIVIEVQP